MPSASQPIQPTKARFTGDPREADLLRGFVIGRSYSWVIAHPEVPLTGAQPRTLQRLLRQRQAGVPLAYLLGHKEFFGRMFQVGPGVLVPRPETEHLIEAALEHIPKNEPSIIVDVGTGSGCIAVTLALERPAITVYATDNSSRALRYAQKNVRQYRLRRRVKTLKGNLLDPMPKQGELPDLIIANLPYATPREFVAVRKEPRQAIVGGRDGLAVFRVFFTQLKSTHWNIPVLLEIDPRRYQAIRALAQRMLPKTTVQIRKDLAGHIRVVLIRPPSIAA